MTSPASPTSRPLRAAWLFAALVVLFAWVYWPTLATLVSRWSSDSGRFYWPIFAAIVVWFRRASFPADRIGPSWLGVPLLLLAAGMRLVSSPFGFEWLEAGSLLPAVAGVVLLTFGLAVARWAWPVAAFLVFILPWPWRLDQMLALPLQRIATVCSTYLLQTLGVPALARGTVIVINEQEIGVVEACSGLGMVMTFFALSTSVALIVRRPWFDRLTIFFSAVPIGVLMNVIRITATVWLYQVADAETAKVVFHDVAGWFMMPLALLVMWLEMLYLKRLWQPIQKERSVPIPVPIVYVPAPATPPRWATRRVEKTSRPEAAERSLQEIPDVAP